MIYLVLSNVICSWYHVEVCLAHMCDIDYLFRRLRNRDAAVRSRERKKEYVKDLETKSKYLERECMRLGRMLQCLASENQSLRLCMQKGGNNNASITKQESAVLLLGKHHMFFIISMLLLVSHPYLAGFHSSLFIIHNTH